MASENGTNIKDYSVVNEVSGTLNTNGQNILGILTDLKSQLEGLSGEYWQGPAASAFQSKVISDFKKYDGVVVSIAGASYVLDTILANYQNVDETIVNNTEGLNLAGHGFGGHSDGGGGGRATIDDVPENVRKNSGESDYKYKFEVANSKWKDIVESSKGNYSV